MAMPAKRKKIVKNNKTSKSSNKKSGSNLATFGVRYMKNLMAKKNRLNSNNAKSTTPPPKRTKREPVESVISRRVTGAVTSKSSKGSTVPTGTIIKKAPVKQKPTTAKQARKEGREERKSLRKTKRAKKFVKRKVNKASRKTTRTQNEIKRQAKRTAKVKKRNAPTISNKVEKRAKI